MMRSKLLIATTLVILLATGFLATTFISYFAARDSVTEQIKRETLPLTSDNIYSEIQRDLLTPILISSLMASDTFVRNWAIEGEQIPQEITHYLGEIKQKYDTITAFFISESTRRYYHPSGIIKVIDRKDPADSWYFNARDMKKPFQINIDYDTADRSRLNIFINYQVMDYRGKLLGITGVGLSVNSVIQLIELYESRYNRKIYFIDRSGKIVLHNNPDMMMEKSIQERVADPGLTTRILTNPSTALSYKMPGKGTAHLNSRLVPEFEWYLIVEQLPSTATNRIERTLITNIMISLAITVLILTLAYFTIRDYQRRLEKMATSDKLTGVASRQVFDGLFERAEKIASRRHHAISIMVIDVDHFKQVIDKYGHQGGDAVLMAVTSMIRQHVRETDIICRWGGEEFLVLLEDCTKEQAMDRAQTLCHSVAQQPVRFGKDEISFTVSLGIAQHLPGESLEALVHRADSAMYVAKREGRNRVSSG